MENNTKHTQIHPEISAEDFIPATKNEKESLVVMRKSIGFWKDGFRRLCKDPLTIVSFVIIVLIAIFAYIVPVFYPYKYEEQIKGNENLKPMQYSEAELEQKEAGEQVFPHILGTDNLGRDYAVRLMIGTRVSMFIGIGASFLILIIGATYGAISGYIGGLADQIMMRIVDILTTVPDILVIILLMVTLKPPLQKLADTVPALSWIRTVGVPIICVFIVFGLLYWVDMARIVRSQILTLKENEYVLASRAMGAGSKWIICKHLLTNCMGTLIVTTTLQIPRAIFTESFLSFLGIGVAAPLPSLGSLATSALETLQVYPHRMFAPALLISVIILTLNLLGDGLRDAFDPKLKQ